MNTESTFDLIKSSLKRQWFFVVAFVVAAFIFIGTLLGVTLFTNRVTIVDGDSVTTISTIEKTAEAILKKNEINLSKDDKISFNGIENNEGTITINRAFPVQIHADGGTFAVSMTEGSVADALKLAGVSLFAEDIISIPTTASVAKDAVIDVRRVTTLKRNVDETLPFATSSVATPTLKKGKTKVATAGVDGVVRTVVEDTFIDGKLTTSETVETLTLVPAVDEILSVGTGVANVVSPLAIPDSLKFDENGTPLNYSKVYTGKSAGYSARPGAKTASGRTAQVGYVAVDPKLIPYGTKLYIASTDGKSVYGYAVAADTGTALLDGRILVDLFFGSYEASCDWAVKQVNIFVLN